MKKTFKLPGSKRDQDQYHPQARITIKMMKTTILLKSSVQLKINLDSQSSVTILYRNNSMMQLRIKMLF